MADQPSKRVAIVGTGMAGEVAAFTLHNHSHHKVEAIYEAADRPGLHVHSLRTEDGIHVDVPLRAASSHYYPNLMKLYKLHDIPLQAVDYSSCGSTYRPNAPYFRYRNILISGLAIPFIWIDAATSMSLLLDALRIIMDLLWFVFTGPYYLCHNYEELSAMTLGAFLNRHNYSYVFVHKFLYPVMSTLLSCSYDQVDKYPAHFIMEFFSARKTTIFTGWRRVTNAGVEEVSKKLLEKLPKDVFHFNNKVQSVEADSEKGGVWVTDCNGKKAHYDVVIIATEPHIAAAIWKGTTGVEKEVMCAASTYTANIMVHRDATLMPNTRSNWCGLNFFSLGTEYIKGPGDLPDRFTASMTTALLKNFNKNLGDQELFETWNSYREVDPKLVIKDTTMTRSVWTVEGAQAHAKHLGTIQGARGVYLAGSYCSPGITLLEQAATSSLIIAEAMGAKMPFKISPTYESTWWSLLLSHILVFGSAMFWTVLTFVLSIGSVKFVVDKTLPMLKSFF